LRAFYSFEKCLSQTSDPQKVPAPDTCRDQLAVLLKVTHTYLNCKASAGGTDQDEQAGGARGAGCADCSAESAARLKLQTFVINCADLWKFAEDPSSVPADDCHFALKTYLKSFKARNAPAK
jgi:hypothetical protein